MSDAAHPPTLRRTFPKCDRCGRTITKYREALVFDCRADCWMDEAPPNRFRFPVIMCGECTVTLDAWIADGGDDADGDPDTTPGRGFGGINERR